MLYIQKGSEPKELGIERRKLIGTPDTVPSFERLDGHTKSIVLKTLLQDQGYLCAYCMRRTSKELNASIEHVVAQRSPEGLDDPLLSLKYGNMVAVCDGQNGETCDKHRKNQPMKVNPLNKRHIESIYYDRSGRINSTDKDIDFDIDVTLNLNSSKTYLQVNRKKAMRAVQDWLFAEVSKKKIENDPKAKARLCSKKVEVLSQAPDKKEEYLGVILFELNRLMRKFE